MDRCRACAYEAGLLENSSVCADVPAASTEGPRGILRVNGDSEDTYLAPPVGLPAGAPPGPAGLLGSGSQQITAVLVLNLGLVLVETGYLPLLGSLATAHRTLERKEQRKRQHEYNASV